MNGYFISRSGTPHVVGKLHRGRLVGPCGFSLSVYDEDLPLESGKECAWCQASFAAALALQAEQTPAEGLLPRQGPAV
jgi:hypothetical protein